MATKNRKSPTLKQRIEFVKSGKLDPILPGGGAIKKIGGLIKKAVSTGKARDIALSRKLAKAKILARKLFKKENAVLDQKIKRLKAAK